MKSITFFRLTAVVFLLMYIQGFAQNGTRLIGYDAITSGRGGAATGIFDNASLMMNNPAGLSFLKASQLDASMSLMAPSVYFTNTINDTKGKNNLFPLGSISYVKKGNKKLTFGVGIFTQGGMGADFTLNHALYKKQTNEYMMQDYHSKFAVMQGGVSIAYKLSKTFSLGITANVLYSMMEFQMPMSMPPQMMLGVINPSTGFTFGDMFSAPTASGGLGYNEVSAAANMSGLNAVEFNGKIGIAYQPNNKFSFGVNYTLPVKLHYKNGTANMDMTSQMNDAFSRVVSGIMQQNPSLTASEAQSQAMSQFSDLGIDLSKGASDKYNANASLGLPQSLAAGISFSATQQLRVSVDAEWINWANAFDNMNISLSGGTNKNISRMMGTIGSIEMPFPLQWKDVLLIRIGADWEATKKLTLRYGYAYGNNPVPESTVFPVFPAVVKHHISVGGSLQLSKQVILNAAYEHAFKNLVTASSVSLVGDQFNNSISGLANNIYHVSISWKMRK
ncbi:MAG: outer membrane protein transport protein [Bacteroidota bacterium]|nr:outer membrane protein transport protein [Bacteroidota bacterium]